MKTFSPPPLPQLEESQTPSNPWGKGYIPSLDGWRALSILIVLGAHSKDACGFPPYLHKYFYWLFDGNLGVRCFFIISGFLITTLMLRESANHGRIDLKSFYLRRSIRILPVYFCFLISIFALQIFTNFEQPLKQWIHLLTFTTNFSSVGNWLTGHTWSLACEEQFYLIWPILFLFFGLSAPKRSGVALLILTLITAPLLRVIFYLKIIIVSDFNALRYIDTLAIGCLLAYVHPLIPKLLKGKHLRIACIISSLLILAPHFLSTNFLLGIFTVPLGQPCQAFGIAFLISLSIHYSQTGIARVLNWKSVIWLGQISYSIYIWQQFFCAKPETFGWEAMWFQTFPFWIIPTLITAVASYYLLERPLVALRKRLGNH